MLDDSACADEIVKRTDKDNMDFVGYNDTEEKAIECFGDALDALSEMIFPASTVAAARAVFDSAAVGMSNTVTGLATLISACNTYAATLGGGMAGYGLTTAPSFLPIDFGDASLNLPGITPQDAADYQSAKFKARMMTGVSTLLVPPFTVQSWQ